MATLQELAAKVSELQGVVDAEQEQIANAIAALEATIADLEDLVAQGGSADDRQAVVDSLNAIKEDLEATIPDEDEEPEIPEEPVEPEPEV